MGHRAKRSGKSKKTRKNKTRKPKPKVVVLPLSRHRVRYPEKSEEWSPWLYSSLRRKRVKVVDGSFRWMVLPPTPDTKKIARLSREAFDAWQQNQSCTTSP